MSKVPPTQVAKKAPGYIDPDEMLAKFRQGTSYEGVVQFRDGEVRFRILTRDEEMKIRREAIAHASKFGGDSAERDDYIEKFTLSAASTLNGQPSLPISLFKSFTSNEMDFLYDEYIKIRDDANPSLEKLTIDEFNALVDAVKKNAVGWKDLSLAQLRAIFSVFRDMIQKQETQE